MSPKMIIVIKLYFLHGDKELGIHPKVKPEEALKSGVEWGEPGVFIGRIQKT